MARGAKPGERRGGRGKGTPNKRTRDLVAAMQESGKRDPFWAQIETHEILLDRHAQACAALAAFEKKNAKIIAAARLTLKPNDEALAMLRELERLEGVVDALHAKIHALAAMTIPFLHAKLSSSEVKADVTTHEQALAELDDDESAQA